MGSINLLIMDILGFLLNLNILINHTHISALFNSQDNVLYAGTLDEGVYKSINNGNKWDLINTDIKDINSIATTSNGFLFIATWNGIFKSEDDGISFIKLENVINNNVWCIAVNSNNKIIAGTEGGIIKSTDYGENWFIVNKNIAFDLFVNSNNEIFAGGFSEILKSSDEGKNWDEITDGVPIGPIQNIKTGLNLSVFLTSNFKVYRSLDNGNHWSLLDNWLNDDIINSLEINSRGQIFVGTFTKGVFRSIDNGENWAQINGGLFNYDIYSMTIDSAGKIFIGSWGDGVFRRHKFNNINWKLYSIISDRLYYFTKLS